ELELPAGQTTLVDQPAGLAHQRLVMGGDGQPATPVDEVVHQRHEVAVDQRPLGVGDRGRLDVDALYQPHAGRQLGQHPDVVERASQVGLEHDADVVVAGLAQGAVDAQRGVGEGAVLHVDADEVAVPGGRDHHTFGERLGER